MEYSTIGKGQDISVEGVIYDKGSVYDRLHQLTDQRRQALYPANGIDGRIVSKVKRRGHADRNC